MKLPLRVVREQGGGHYQQISITDDDGDIVSMNLFNSISYPEPATAMDDLRRIVASANRCAGMDVGDIEKAPSPARSQAVTTPEEDEKDETDSPLRIERKCTSCDNGFDYGYVCCLCDGTGYQPTGLGQAILNMIERRFKRIESED